MKTCASSYQFHSGNFSSIQAYCMNSQTQRSTIAGAAGAIEIAIDMPAAPPPGSPAAPRGVAIVAHPHPLFGGTLDNKVAQTMARAFVQAGWTAVRFNFRGVGASAGEHDEGIGEAEDYLTVLRHTAPDAATPLALAGFSFGAFVATHALAQLQQERAATSASSVAKVVLVGLSVSRALAAPVDAALHDKTLVIHGEADDTVLLADVLDWARPQALPVLVVPGGGHFFHGQLPLLKSLVLRHVAGS